MLLFKIINTNDSFNLFNVGSVLSTFYPLSLSSQHVSVGRNIRFINEGTDGL